MAKLIVVNTEPWQCAVLLSDASLCVVVCVCSGQCIPSLFLFALPSCSSRDRGESGPAVRLPRKPDLLARLQFSSLEFCVRGWWLCSPVVACLRSQGWPLHQPVVSPLHFLYALKRDESRSSKMFSHNLGFIKIKLKGRSWNWTQICARTFLRGTNLPTHMPKT